MPPTSDGISCERRRFLAPPVVLAELLAAVLPPVAAADVAVDASSAVEASAALVEDRLAAGCV